MDSSLFFCHHQATIKAYEAFETGLQVFMRMVFSHKLTSARWQGVYSQLYGNQSTERSSRSKPVLPEGNTSKTAFFKISTTKHGDDKARVPGNKAPLVFVCVATVNRHTIGMTDDSGAI